MDFVFNGHSWRIMFVSPNNPELYRKNGTVTLGVTDINSRTIYINQNLNSFLTQKVICHELVHVACFEYGYVVSEETEEFIADFLATYGKNVLNVADRIASRIFKRA